MTATSNSLYTFYVIAPFNTRMVLDNMSLIGNYEDFRKAMYKKLNLKYPNKVIIEKLMGDSNPSESIRNWLNEDASIACVQDEDIRLFKATGESGVTMKDKSLFVLNLNEEFKLSLDAFGHDIFTSPPMILLETMSFHEYGVGMAYCRVDINFKQDLLRHSELSPKQILANLLDNVVKDSILPSILV